MFSLENELSFFNPQKKLEFDIKSFLSHTAGQIVQYF